MASLPILVCTGPVPTLLRQAQVHGCIHLISGETDLDTIFRLKEDAAENGGDRNRCYVVIGGEDALVGWHYAARFADCVTAIVATDGAFNPDVAVLLRNVPVMAPADIVRLLHMEGNRVSVKISNGFDQAAMDWLMVQDLSLQQRVSIYQPGLYGIEAGVMDSFYLVEGADKAMLIDTGMSRTNMRPMVERLTCLPIECAATHVHGDHIYHCDEFDKVYLCEDDYPLIQTYVDMMMKVKGYTEATFTPFKDGDVFDLGGGVTLEAVQIGGHTPGSVCFVDRYHEAVFAGDAIGSGYGVYMALPGSMCVSEYRKNLIIFREKMEPFRDFSFYGGHRPQERGMDPTKHQRNPLCLELVDDMISLCDQVLAEGENFGEETRYVTFGRANMWIDGQRVR